MRALLLDGSPRVVTDHPEPRRHPGEALIEMRLAGVCDTDLQLVRGYMGYRGVLGHEMVGLVLEADDGRWVGRRVVADINAGCGHCDECRTRGGHHCQKRTVLGILGRDGALAERMAVPERCLVEVPEALGDERAVFAEPLAAAVHVLDELGPAHRDVFVLGDGKLGLLIALGLHGAGRSPVLVGHHRAKLELAAMAGVSVTLESELRAEPCADAVIEATGNAGGLTRALSMLRTRGLLVLKTTVAEPAAIDLAPVVVNELRVVGSRCGDMKRAVELLATGAVDPTALIAARFPLHQADRALAKAAESGVLKVLVQP